MSRYRTLSERKAARERYRNEAVASAEMKGKSLTCQYVSGDMDHPNHQLCKGELPGNSGCLCRCHDRDFS